MQPRTLVRTNAIVLPKSSCAQAVLVQLNGIDNSVLVAMDVPVVVCDTRQGEVIWHQLNLVRPLGREQLDRLDMRNQVVWIYAKKYQ
jgi:hypothetical protein